MVAPKSSVAQGTALCRELREANSGIWEAIDNHPFLKEIEGGTLPDRVLKYYFTQNVHYINCTVQIMAIGAAKAPDQEVRDFCVSYIQRANSHIATQSQYATNLPGGDVPTDPSHVTHAYVRHQLAIAYEGTTADMLTVHLPCPWTYEFIGNRLAPVVTNPVHSEWLEAFGNEDHTEGVEQYLSIVSRLTNEIPEWHRKRLHREFRTTMRLEWMFWEMAYREEFWPI